MADLQITKKLGTADVVVVGAGLSGLTAARRLVERGLSVIVLEANARVGGRTLSEPHGAGTFDLGGQWLGPKQSRMLRLAGELGVKTYPQYHQGEKVMELRGKRLTHKGTIPPLAPHELLAVHFGLGRADKLFSSVPLHAPETARHAAEWDGMTMETWKRRNLPFAAGRALFDVAVQVVFGAEAAELSLLHFLFYLNSGGGLMSLVEIEGGAQETRVVGGTQQFSQKLADKLGDRVRLEAPVRLIEQREGGVVVHSDLGAVEAQRVILALPPPMAGRIRYAPELPFLRDQLTQRTPMGATIKCIALYDKPFWRDAGLSGEAVCPDGPAAVTFDNVAHDHAGNQQASLLAFLVGNSARQWGSRPAEERKQAVLAQLGRLFGPAATRPTGFIEKDWSTEPFIRGCPVANFAPGGLTTFGKSLREPIGRIHWAGTETATEWNGYMEGALQAGERAAEEVGSRTNSVFAEPSSAQAN